MNNQEKINTIIKASGLSLEDYAVKYGHDHQILSDLVEGRVSGEIGEPAAMSAEINRRFIAENAAADRKQHVVGLR
ncbi:hypothetical protein NQX30_05505 [Candidatus Persebacteraceae bacterium Df01]|jgi:hypothetical protein|uniref:Uncharacterized protein n=1 Tax=Candidatus Doriopsillibacter californiensis TaxID=2970740 RepID=A0ABT7QM79_9GAMM|nr:hypothetical protein [Candidatus Persebacteraceae bacterium Df01]